jgi:hypothetical protein
MMYWIVILCLFITPAFATWKSEYANSPPEVQEWYRTRTLTPEAQKRFHFVSCCAHSDVVKTKFKVGGAGKDEWYWMDQRDNTWKRVPPDIIHWNQHAPGGQPVLFAFATNGEPTCFFPPDAGL